MTNLHTPERGENESFEDYKARRKASQEAVKITMKGPRQNPWPPGMGEPNWVHWWKGQHTTTPERKQRRDLVRSLGKRAFKTIFG
jgi:hypothetical protein